MVITNFKHFVLQIENHLEVFDVDDPKKMLDRITEFLGPLSPLCKRIAGRLMDKDFSDLYKSNDSYLRCVDMYGETSTTRAHIYLGTGGKAIKDSNDATPVR